MLHMDKQKYLSNLSEYEGLSLRKIAERSGHHFNTVKKYVSRDDWNDAYKPRKAQKTRLEPLKDTIDAWIIEDLKKKKKFRRTATKIYKDLQKDEKLRELLVVGQQSVINYVSKRKKELIKNTYETAMFWLYSMCEAQVDFGDVPVIGANGNEEIWHELVISFPWSNAGFAQLCKFETKECLCEALQNIFEFIGGVPIRILFDNMSSAVVHIEENGKRTLTEMFMRFTMHHRFKAEFCNPDSPNEKGNVENKVGYIRRNYLLPAPKINDIEAFNRNLLDECIVDLERNHYVKNEQIIDMFKAEQEALIPLPRERFRVFTMEKVKADKYSFIHFENIQYSTSPEYANCEMWLETGTKELRVLNEKYEEVVVHQRRFGKNFEPAIDFENYIGTLSRKPRAFLNSPYFPTLPEPVQKHLKSCVYADLKKILLTLVPIIREGKIGDAAAVFELSAIRNADDFAAAYRALTEDPRLPESVTTPLTPVQKPYLPKLDQYKVLYGGDSDE
ncbi:integrase [Clostridia bacterium]|nr:integrase [Clostridia bacterium]